MSAKRKLPGVSGTIFSEIVHLTETGSTNADLLEVAKLGAPEGVVEVTDHQNAGRGRQSRVWHDDPGNSVLMSILIHRAPPVAAIVPALMGLAVVDSLNQLEVEASSGPNHAGPQFGLKWPNDVLALGHDERKVAGILVEATTVAAQQRSQDSNLAVVAGVGINLRWSDSPDPEVAQRATTVERVVGSSVERWELVRKILAELDHRLNQTARAGIGPQMEQYRQRCLTLGRRVRLVTSTGELEGTATGVGDDGALLVETADGLRSVHAADAHHI